MKNNNNMLKLNAAKSTGMEGLTKVIGFLEEFGVDTKALTIHQAVDISIDIRKVIEKRIKHINKTK